tara:strand:+ start:424 stop:690 length:267 start_codon:yes stop_codon:yes gene_type:complete
MTKYEIVYEKFKNGYSAYVPDLPGCKRLPLENINQEKNLNKRMKDQKAILIKCIKNDVPAFVIAGQDLFAVPTLEAYYWIAKENGAVT